MGGELSELAVATAALTAADPRSVPPHVLAERIVELRRLIDGLEGTWSRMVAVLDGSGAIEGGTTGWLRSACRLAPAAARSRVTLSRRLTERPVVAEALSAGEVSIDHARLITTALDELAAVDPRLAAETETPLLAAARQLDPARLRREIAHARYALVPEAAATADELVHQRRHLDVATTFDGVVTVNGVLAAEAGETVLTALAALSSRAGPDDERSPGQRRADALVELCRRQLDRAELPALGGERPHLTVLVPLAALAPTAARPALTGPAHATRSRTERPTEAATGAPTQTGCRTATGARVQTERPTETVTRSRTERPTEAATGDRAQTGGRTTTATGARTGGRTEVGAAAAMRGGAGGMVGVETMWSAVLGPEAARRLACDASVTRVVLDADSQPLDVGRRTRVIPAAIRAALVARDRGCTHPGCDRPPQWTDAHHVVHWADGGPTSLDNLVLLCRQHHRTVHEGRSPVRAAQPRAA